MWGSFLNGSRRGFFGGLAMVGAGVGLTIASAIFALEFGWGVSFIFYGLVIVGLIRMVISIPALIFGDGDMGSARRSGRVMAQPYVAPPSEIAQGLCWMCGGKVRRGNLICLHCGAAQPGVGPDESEAARMAGYDPTAGELVTFLPSDGPVAGSPYPSAAYPVVAPGAPPQRQRAGQWGAQPPAPPPHGAVWRPTPEKEGEWDDEPAKESLGRRVERWLGL
jgi:hypothetical protein